MTKEKTEEKDVPQFVPREGQMDFSHARWAPVVNCVVMYEGKVLLVERNSRMHFYPGYWNGISGFLDDHRSLEEKVKDEVGEELGIGEDAIDAITLCEIFDQDEPEYTKTWIVHAALVTVSTDSITLDWEAAQYAWVLPEALHTYKLLPGFDRVLNAVFAHVHRADITRA